MSSRLTGDSTTQVMRCWSYFSICCGHRVLYSLRGCEAGARNARTTIAICLLWRSLNFRPLESTLAASAAHPQPPTAISHGPPEPPNGIALSEQLAACARLASRCHTPRLRQPGHGQGRARLYHGADHQLDTRPGAAARRMYICKANECHLLPGHAANLCASAKPKPSRPSPRTSSPCVPPPPSRRTPPRGSRTAPPTSSGSSRPPSRASAARRRPCTRPRSATAGCATTRRG